jgi:hypothetical protein
VLENFSVGVWLDRSHAALVYLAGGDVTVFHMRSGVEPRFRVSGGSRSRTPYGPQQVVSEQKQEQRAKLKLRQYYKHLMDTMRGADGILVLGPGEAKLGLEKAIRDNSDLCRRLRSVRTADRMTERQLVAAVKKFYEQEGKYVHRAKR